MRPGSISIRLMTPQSAQPLARSCRDTDLMLVRTKPHLTPSSYHRRKSERLPSVRLVPQAYVKFIVLRD